MCSCIGLIGERPKSSAIGVLAKVSVSKMVASEYMAWQVAAKVQKFRRRRVRFARVLPLESLLSFAG
jgi:hypothetical protein